MCDRAPPPGCIPHVGEAYEPLPLQELEPRAHRLLRWVSTWGSELDLQAHWGSRLCHLGALEACTIFSARPCFVFLTWEMRMGRKEASRTGLTQADTQDMLAASIFIIQF